MSSDGAIQIEQILRGRAFNEPMRVVTVRPGSDGGIEAGLVGQRTQ